MLSDDDSTERHTSQASLAETSFSYHSKNYEQDTDKLNTSTPKRSPLSDDMQTGLPQKDREILILKAKISDLSVKLRCQEYEHNYLKDLMQELKSELESTKDKLKQRDELLYLKDARIDKKDEQIIQLQGIVNTYVMEHSVSDMSRNSSSVINRSFSSSATDTRSLKSNVNQQKQQRNNPAPEAQSESGPAFKGLVVENSDKVVDMLTPFMINEAQKNYQDEIQEIIDKATFACILKHTAFNTIEDDNKCARLLVRKTFSKDELKLLCLNKQKVKKDNPENQAALIEISAQQITDLYNVYRTRLDIFGSNGMNVSQNRYHISTFTRAVSAFLPRERKRLYKESQQSSI